MNWIERGDIEELEGIQNLDRPRGLAAVTVLVEMVVAIWISVPAASLPTAAGGGGQETRMVSLVPLHLWPTPAVQAGPEESQSATEIDEIESPPPAAAPPSEFATGPGTGDSLSGNAVQDDIRIASATPTNTVAVWVGDTVNFQFAVEYNLASAASAPVQLTIEECTCEPVPLASIAAIPAPDHFKMVLEGKAERGRNTLAFAGRFRVPVAQLLEVTARFAGNGNGKGPSDSRAYPVFDPGRPPTGERNTIRIASSFPDPARPLRPGVDVDLETIVEYNLTTERGTLNFLVEGVGAEPPRQSEPIRKGQRRFSFRQKIRTPAGDSDETIRVSVQLNDGEALATTTYKIEEPRR